MFALLTIGTVYNLANCSINSILIRLSLPGSVGEVPSTLNFGNDCLSRKTRGFIPQNFVDYFAVASNFSFVSSERSRQCRPHNVHRCVDLISHSVDAWRGLRQRLEESPHVC